MGRCWIVIGEQDFTDYETNTETWTVSAHPTKEEADRQMEILNQDRLKRHGLEVKSRIWGDPRHPLVDAPLLDPRFDTGLPFIPPSYSVVEIPFGEVFTPPEYPAEDEPEEEGSTEVDK